MCPPSQNKISSERENTREGLTRAAPPRRAPLAFVQPHRLLFSCICICLLRPILVSEGACLLEDFIDAAPLWAPLVLVQRHRLHGVLQAPIAGCHLQPELGVDIRNLLQMGTQNRQEPQGCPAAIMLHWSCSDREASGRVCAADSMATSRHALLAAICSRNLATSAISCRGAHSK